MGEIKAGFKFEPNVKDTFRYLRSKVYGIQEPNVKLDLVKEIDLYQSCPEDHQGLSKEECTYFFTQKVAINQSGRVSDRKTKDGKGYWFIRTSKEFEMGIRNTLNYYLKGGNVKGKGLKTDWIMHEYALKPKPADAKVKVKKTTVLCRIYHKKQKKSEGTDVCNAREHEPDTSKDGSREKSMMIESSQEYQQKNIVAPANEEFVCINLRPDDDVWSQGYDQLWNSIPAKDGRGGDGSRDNLMMIGSSQEYQPMNIAAPAYI